LQQLVQAIRDKKICVLKLGNKTEYFWNQPLVFREGLQKAREQAMQFWKFNWDNYVCPVEQAGAWS
jgi:hypothetical protein